MKEIRPGTCTATQQASGETATPAEMLHPPQQMKVEGGSPSPLLLMSFAFYSTSSSSSSSPVVVRRPTITNETAQLQQQQPVSLVVVRLLSDSTSYCTDVEDSVVETTMDAIRPSVGSRPKSLLTSGSGKKKTADQ